MAREYTVGLNCIFGVLMELDSSHFGKAETMDLECTDLSLKEIF